MKIRSAKFVKGIVKEDTVLEDGTPQYAFIGRSNVGKSSLFNALTKTKLARASAYAGRTQEVNLYLINDDTYFLDLPGYGFARTSGLGRDGISRLIEMCLFNPKYRQEKIVLLIDANVGFTDKDTAMFQDLLENGKSVIIAISKIDKLNQSELHTKLTEIKSQSHGVPIVPFSSKTKKGIEDLLDEISRT